MLFIFIFIDFLPKCIFLHTFAFKLLSKTMKKVEEIIPRYDLPVDFIVDKSVDGSILNFYKQFPCKIKAGVFALCLTGEVKAIVNLSEVTAKANDLAIVIPGSFFQIISATPETKVAFIAFSSEFINNVDFWKLLTTNLSAILKHPVISLEEQKANFIINLISTIQQGVDIFPQLIDKESIKNILNTLYKTIQIIYEQTYKQTDEKQPREFQILGEFIKLLFEMYHTERRVSYYADAVHLTQSHFCATIKKATGKTVQEIIREIIITDAKAQLKNTDVKINQIAGSLGFSSSAFNRYFAEYVKMTPLEYRNS